MWGSKAKETRQPQSAAIVRGTIHYALIGFDRGCHMISCGDVRLGKDQRMPGDVQAFRTLEDRVRLTRTAVKAFFRIADAWCLNEHDRAVLLNVPKSDLRVLSSGDWTRSLGEEQLVRVSALVGIYGALETLFADDMARRWLTLLNDKPPFSGRTALQTMMLGGADVLIEIRRYLEAMSNGL